ANNSASDATTIIPLPAPDLSVTKTHTGDFRVNANGTYRITVQNAPGAGPTTGPVTVTDTLPAGVTFVRHGTGSGWTCSAAQQTVTCTRPNVMAANASSGFNLIVRPTSAAVPSVTNTVTVSTPG